MKLMRDNIYEFNNSSKETIISEYLRLQKNYSKLYGNEKTIVLMQVGSFHECYSTKSEGYDLFKLSELLNTVVSKKNKKNLNVDRKNPYMLGFPTIATHKFLRILVENGYHVVKIDQVTPPPSPQRKVTGIYSPGTYIDNLSDSNSNNILSIYIEELEQAYNKTILYIGLSVIDLSIGTSLVHEIFSSKEDDKYSLDICIKFINNFDPKEIIVNTKNLKTVNMDDIILYLEIKNNKVQTNTLKNKELYNINYQNCLLKDIFKINSYLTAIEELNFERINNGRISYIILLDYCYQQNQNILENIQKPNFYNNNKYLHLGNNATLQLNVFRDKNNEKVNKYNSLCQVVNFTKTSMGLRLLKYNLGNPICEIEELNNRYDMINNILDKDVSDEINDILKEILDLERLHRKISLGTLHPIDFSNLHDSYLKVIELYKLLKKNKLKLFDKSFYKKFTKFIEYYTSLFDIDEMSKYLLNDITGSFYKKNIHNEIDTLQQNIITSKEVIKNIRDKFDSFITDKKKKYFNDSKTNVNMIKINFNERDKYHYFVTTRRSNQIKESLKKTKCIKINDIKLKVDDIIFKNQSKSSSTKIFFPLLDNLSDKIISNTELLKNKIKQLYVDDLLKIYEKNKDLLLKLAKYVAEIDFLNSGATCAKVNNYKKPKLVDSERSFIDVKNIRHPIIEKIISTAYKPHNIKLGIDEQTGILLYGLNSAGKSSLMKSIGLNLILAQIGYFTASSKFKFHPYKSLFTRIISTDNIFKGLSSYALELVELKAILKRSGKNTLVLADEVCKGTEHKSALVIVASMIVMLSKSNTSFISATHLHKLTKIDKLNQLNNVKTFHISVSYKDNDIVFDRLLKEGNGREEYGLDFAKFIIDDDNFIKTANDIKNSIENKNNIISTKKSKYNPKIYMDKCDICKSTKNLETHHIKFQKNCDEVGFILEKKMEHIHKNHISNLVVLCEKCHDKIHDNLIIIEGYKETTNGNILDYKIVDRKKKKINNKFNKVIVDYIIDLKSEPNLSQRKVKLLITEKFNKKISISTISKIWRGKYKI